MALCVTVTAENQKWLSPVPMVGDIAIDRYDYRGFGPHILIAKEAFKTEGPVVVMGVCGEIDSDASGLNPHQRHIISRLYHNGQRAPLIEWDEVQTPEKNQ